MLSLQTSPTGRAFIEHQEGFVARAYRDEVGVWTIGYGHTAGVKPGQVVTAAQADAFLVDDLRTAERAVNRLVKVPLAQHEFDALVSFTFNLGAGLFAGSTLLRRLNAGDRRGAAAAFLLDVRAGGKVLPDLVRRRHAEAAMFEGDPLGALARAASPEVA